MAQIDAYLKSMAKLGANGLLLRSGEAVVLKFDSGDRAANQRTPHNQLLMMLNEMAPTGTLSKLQGGGETTFVYRLADGAYSVKVDANGASWTVVVEPSSGVEEPAESEMVVEPTAYQYEEPAVASPASAPATPAPSSIPVGTSPGMATASATAASIATPSGDEKWIDTLLRLLMDRGGSDLHLSSGTVPYMRVNGELKPMEGYDVLEAGWLREQIMAVTPPANQEEFERRNDTDFAHNIPGVSRFRFNVFMDRKGPGVVARTIPFEIPSAEKLGISPAVLDLCNLTKGLVVVTGPTGSGKSTTLAALIDRINSTRHDHIITIEDPIEFVHQNKKCLVNQREIRTHTDSFKDALRAALREDPDIVLVGEMRDLETIAIAIETAETGHLVFGTLHTTTAASTVDRIIDQFPTDRQEQIRQMLSKSLRGVIAQVLCRKVGGGRCAGFEILLANPAVENLIRERKTFQLTSLIQTAGNQGMITMEASLLELVKSGKVEPMEAYRKAVNKKELEAAFARNGIKL